MKPDPPYSALAPVYAHLMRSIDYRDWAAYISDIAEEYIGDDAELLELAAGTGELTSYLLNTFNNITISDISHHMLRQCDLTLPTVCCSMTELPFRKTFDMVYCCFDSVNYLMTKRDLKQLFVEVERILKPGGIFTFDASLESNSLVHEKRPRRRSTVYGIKYKQVSSYNRDTKVHTNIFTIVMPDGQQFKETHKQRVYEFEDYFHILSQTSLYVVECYEAFSFNEGTPNSPRLQFVVKKRDTDARN